MVNTRTLHQEIFDQVLFLQLRHASGTLRTCLCTTSFKSLLKTYLMSQVFKDKFLLCLFFFVLFGVGFTAP